MKVILLEDIKGVGKKDQVINASDGHAKNFLFPRKLAIEATKENMSSLAFKHKKEEERKAKELEEAQELAKQIEQHNLKIHVKTGDNGKLFGAVTNKEVAHALEEQANIKIDKKKIAIKDGIKSVGEALVDVKLHTSVIAKLKVSIVGQ